MQFEYFVNQFNIIFKQDMLLRTGELDFRRITRYFFLFLSLYKISIQGTITSIDIVMSKTYSSCIHCVQNLKSKILSTEQINDLYFAPTQCGQCCLCFQRKGFKVRCTKIRLRFNVDSVTIYIIARRFVSFPTHCVTYDKRHIPSK